MKVVQNLVPQGKYALKCLYGMKPQYIVVHNTANDASARSEVAYMIRNDRQTGYHYAVDDREVVQGIPDDRNAWHAGDGNGKGNRSGIGIEICYSKSGGKRFEDAEKLAAKLIAFKLKEYGLGIDRVIRHFDCSGKNCPHRTMALGWDRFLKMVKKELRSPSGYASGEKSNDFFDGLDKDMSKSSPEKKLALKSKLKGKFRFDENTCNYILAYPNYGEELAYKILNGLPLDERSRKYILAYPYGREILRRAYG